MTKKILNRREFMLDTPTTESITMIEKKRIEFGELQIGPVACQHIKDCLDSNWISMGPKTRLLEERFAALMGCKYGVATSSGTSSLVAMTLALPEIAKRKVIRGKSKVLCPALAFIANSTAIVSGGLIPKWVDTKTDLNIDENNVEDAIDDDVVAIYAVGTMGKPSQMDVLADIAKRYDLILFEDACENYGSKLNNRFSHEYAIGACTSFFQAHLIQAGEGSVVFTNNEQLASLITSIRSHGRDGNSAYFDHLRFGSNFKPTDLCSAIALEGVENFHESIKERKKIWRELVDYSKQFEDLAWFSDEGPNMEVMPHGFSITIKPHSKYNIEDLKKCFDKSNIHWKRNFGFCGSHSALRAYCPDNYENLYTNAIYFGQNGIHIGCHRYITEENINRIKVCLEEFFR